MKVSIIVPVLNESGRIGKLIRLLRGLRGEKEIIISDGGSTDGTLEELEGFSDVIVINAASGRASQMNAGAEVATGEVLWFVHADSVVEATSIEDIAGAIKEGAVGGFFRIYFYDADDGFMNFIARTSHTRAKEFCLIFGDQGIFLRRDIFDGIGGYAEIALMEDWEISRRLRKFHKEGNICALNSKIGTSARRYIDGGRIRTWLKMNVIKGLYILGIPTKMLRWIYDGR